MSPLPSVARLTGRKVCTDCGTEKAVDAFHKRSRGRGDCDVFEYCKDCQRIRIRNRSPEIRRRATLKKKYGLTPELFDEILEEQGGICLICRQVCEDMVVDHNHETGRVRAIICRLCNSALGFLRDSPVAAENASHYLRMDGNL